MNVKFVFRNIILGLGIFLLAIACTDKKPENKYTSKGKIDYTLSASDAMMLDTIQRKTFEFFRHERAPEKNIVKDRAADWASASIAATGFGLPVYATAAERGWITREEAAQVTNNILDFFAYSDQSADTLTTGYKGFYYHFLDLKNGKRTWNCELSTIDTGLLLMGVIFARNYYDQDNATENNIRNQAQLLLSRLDWEFFLMPEDSKHPHTISMGWSPEDGMINNGWTGYNEGLFLYILAAGTGMVDVKDSYDAWLSTYKWYTPYEGLSHVAFPPLFGHQFSHIFIDFRGLYDPYMKEKGIDYFENSRRASLVQQKYAEQNPYGWKGYNNYCWGITASDGPGSTYDFDGKKFYAYAGRGTSGPEYNYFDDGTIAPYGSFSSLPFIPEVVLATINNINNTYGEKLWGTYGYYDSFNPTADWVDSHFIGIDEGPLILMIENFRSGLVWNYVMKDPVIQKGLEVLDFQYVNK